MSTDTKPGLRDQSGARAGFRAAGGALLVFALFFLISGLVDFFHGMGSDSMDGPGKFWMVFVGILLLGPAGWCLQAGFMGAASRYVAGETMPVVKDSASYLTDGKGIAGIGKTDDDATPATGPYCSKCGTRNDEHAKFCDSCGAPLAS
jgi:hypothetical protein